MIRNLHDKLGIPAEVLIQSAWKYRRLGVEGDRRKASRGHPEKIGVASHEEIVFAEAIPDVILNFRCLLEEPMICDVRN